MEFSGRTEIKQGQRQSPQQYLISTMVQSTTDELVQLINRETEKNVALEVDDPREVSLDAPASSDNEDNDDMEANVQENEETKPTTEIDTVSYFDNDDNSGSDRMGIRNADEEEDNTPGRNTATEDSFRDDLKRQIGELDIDDEEKYLACYIIDSLENDGYLRRPLIELVDDLEFNQHHTTTEEDLEAVLVEIVQEELEPSGIGARDLRECMLLQIQEKTGPLARIAYSIVDLSFNDVANNRWDRIEQAFGITNHQVIVDVRRLIRHLNPKPGDMGPVTAKSSSARVQQVMPEFTIRVEDGHLVVSLNDGQVPKVRISAESQQDLERYQEQAQEKEAAGNKTASAEMREGARFMREAIQNANLFIDALTQRRNTLMEVMQTIVEMQRGYFLTGQDEALKPMTLEDVANRCSFDISTISRVTNNKFVDTEFGIIPIRQLFTNEVAGSNQTAVMNVLKQIIDTEDKTHPLNDDGLCAELERQGYPIARRTVSKYREILGFPVARLRKET